MSKKIKLILSGLVLGFAAVATPFLQPLVAQGSDCNSLPTITHNNNVQATAEYRVWVLAKKDTDNAKPYVQVGNGQCHELGVPSGNGWEWVSGPSNGRVVQRISAGQRAFKLSVDNGAIFMDKLLITNDLNCVPDGDGEGCLERSLDFAISGLADGETIAGSRTISASLVNQVANVTIDFAFNGGPVVSSPSQAPFCLVAGTSNRCAAYDLSRLGAGSHTLRVTARSAAGQTITKVTPFVVAQQNVPVPAPEPTPEPTPTPDPSPNPSQGGLKLDVKGVKNNDTISGSPVISAEASGSSKPITVTYKLDSHKLSHRSVAPYCLVVKDNKCTGWDTNTFPNGDYKLYVVASAEGYRELWQTIPVKINNTAPVAAPVETPKETAQPTESEAPKQDDKSADEKSAKEDESKDESKQNVVVGKSKQQISGLINLLVPQKYVQPGSTVTFRSGDRVILTIPAIRLASADFDTAQLPNGTHLLSATVTTTGGSEEVLSSEVEVKNNPFVSFSRWVDNNRTVAIVGTIMMILAVFGATFFIVRTLYNRQFAKKQPKNLEGAVVGASAMSKSQASRQALFGVAVAALVAVGAFSFFRLGSTALAAGLGFIAEVEDGTFSSDQFTQDMDHAENRTFIRLFHGGGTEPELPDHGHDDDEHDDEEPGTPSGQPAPNCDLPGGRGRGVQMGSNAPCIDVSAIPAPGPSVSRSSLANAPSSPYPAGQGEPGAFRQRCDFSHMNFDDSVLYPGQPGIAHLHTYFGNANANAASTSTSLSNTGNSTCNGGIFNRSAYWVPSMVDTNTGRPIRPNDPRGFGNSDLEIYYKLGYQGVGHGDIQSFPNGLQLIAGNAATATTPPSNNRTLYWCETMNHGDRNRRLEGVSIPNCGPNQVLVMYIGFPQCWDGRNLTSPSGRSHMAYGQWQPGEHSDTRGCPSTHPTGLPFIEMFVRYHTGNSGNASWRLSSDNYTNSPAGYSGHADYIFAWDSSAFPLVVQNCYRARRDCVYGLGNQREPEHIRSLTLPPEIRNPWSDWRPTYYN